MTGNNSLSEIIEKFKSVTGKNKYLMLIFFVGLVLILIPTGDKNKSSEVKSAGDLEEKIFYVEETEKKLEEILSFVEGAGKVKVMLSVDGTAERHIAEDVFYKDDSKEKETEISEERKTVVIDNGSSETIVELKYIFPRFIGAVVVSDGADDPTVRLNILDAVSSVTQLGTDSIAVIKRSK